MAGGARAKLSVDGRKPVYLTMNGPTEFDVIGRLRTWDRTADLNRITVPTLITCGRHDELTPARSRTILDGVGDGRMEIFEASAHVAHLEEESRYVDVLEGLLDEVDARR